MILRFWAVILLLILGCGVAPLAAQTPSLPPNSVVNDGSFRPATDPNGAIAPGTIVAIFGSNLASDTLVALSVPLSTTLGDTSVTFSVGGQSFNAPLFFVSAGQINAQVPFEIIAGSGFLVQVRRNGGTSSQPVNVAAVSPGIFTTNASGGGQGAIQISNSNPPTFAAPAGSIPGVATRPVLPGEFLTIYCTGLGQVDHPVASGTLSPSTEPLARTTSIPLVNVGGSPAHVDFSGLAPGFVGLYQVNVQVPNVAAGSAVQLNLSQNGVPSNTVTIAVGSP